MKIFNWWDKKRPAFHDAAYERASLPAWDERWDKLSTAARNYLLTNVKSAPRRNSNEKQPYAPAERFADAGVLDELKAQGFLTIREGIGREKGPQAALVNEAVDFLQRMRALRRYHLLDASQPSEFIKYVNYCFVKYELLNKLHTILQKAGINPYTLYGDFFELYVTRRHWPDWVAGYLGDSLADEILEAIERADGRLPMREVARRLPSHQPAEVRAMLEKLITRLALFEDLDPETYELQVGLLPSVRADREEASRPRVRPPLVPCSPPPEPGPESGTDVPDLRAVLLELAGGRARLRQDGALFQKEVERFESLLEPLPGWLIEMYNLSPAHRLKIAFHWAQRLALTKTKKEGGRSWMDLADAGRGWLARRPEEQYAFIYEALRDPKRLAESFDSWSHNYHDGQFLGVQVSAVAAPARRRDRDSWGSPLTPEQRQLLRDALHAAFAELPIGVFHRFDNFVAHTVFGPHNPLLLGLPPEQVQVRINSSPVASLEEQLNEVARHVLDQLVSNRLVSLGCLQAGRDSDGELLISRRPRLDAFFGREAPTEPEIPTGVTKVVVQPDFSVIVIGVDLSPVAELAAFCERVRERSSAGAVTMRITRASVLRAVTAGLSGEDILERLRRHASSALPSNVVHEVREWAGWVRSVSAEPATLFRCPDASTADRIIAALGKRAEKLTATIVSFPDAPLSDAERRKLLEQGIILSRREGEPAPKKGRKKR